MKVAALAALSLLIVWPALAEQRNRQSVLLTVTCDNDGRCTTLSVASAPMASNRTARKKTLTVTTATKAPIAAAAAPTITETAAETKVTTTEAVPSAANTSEVTAEVVKTTAKLATAQALAASAFDANGNKVPGMVVSSKTGARARVGVAYAARFQAYINDLENNYGARVLFMGGIRPGRCLPESQHPCGKALDVCQLAWGRVDPRCNLPDRVTLGRIAAAHGLFEGGRWCHSDYGHAQISVTAAACGNGPFRIVRRTTPEPIADESHP